MPPTAQGRRHEQAFQRAGSVSAPGEPSDVCAHRYTADLVIGIVSVIDHFYDISDVDYIVCHYKLSFR